MLIAQISDLHLLMADDARKKGEDIQRNCRRALAHVMALPTRPDALLITGDIADRGELAAYHELQIMLRSVSIPTFVIPGNHDNRQHMLDTFVAQGVEALAGFMQYCVDVGPLRLIALDTHKLGSDGGELDNTRMAWLAQRLDEAPNKPTLLFMHHPPVQIGLKVLDDIGLDNADAFASLIARHSQIKAVLAGHIHMAMFRPFAKTMVITCPASNHSLAADYSKPTQLAVQMHPPACLLHHWDEARGLTSYVSPITDPMPTVLWHDGKQWL